MLYLLRTGCQWRALPCDFPKWRTVHTYFAKWSEPDADGVSLLERALKKSGWRGPRTTGAQRVQHAVDCGRTECEDSDTAQHKGYDAGKKVSGNKRHIAADSQGLPHAIAVTTAEVTDRAGALQALARCSSDLQGLKRVLCDSGYTGDPFAQGVKAIAGEEVTVQIASSELHTFKVIPKRWVVERSFAWLEKSRRLWKNCERKLNTSFQFIQLPFLALLIKRSGTGSKAETAEIDIHLDALPEFERLLQGLRHDNLPKFEQTFKDLLNLNTIHEIANFNGQLARERETIKQRIEVINQSLQVLDYNPGRYIHLQATANTDVEIRDFQQDLRTCTDGAFSGSEDEQYSEDKFLQVKAIIDRLRGREGFADADRRWVQKVTDVRNWFLFSASERWREDDEEFEHYADSGGKSGGQKEKLAYTVLAASLANQFGLKQNEVKSRSFRFVVIDEAFGRGSDESAHYGLELFRKLNLQLLIVTPLQKIHIIEPYVCSVGFVHNEGGSASKLRSLSIEEYHAEKAANQDSRTT